LETAELLASGVYVTKEAGWSPLARLYEVKAKTKITPEARERLKAWAHR
jgi:hypothetical protein